MTPDGAGRAHRDVASRLLEAGRDLLGTTDLPTLLPGVRAVCKAAGVATSSFYWAFPDVEAFWAELLRTIADNDIVLAYVPETVTLLEAAAAEIRADRTALLPVVRATAAANLEFHLQEGRAAFQLQLMLLGANGGPPELSDTVRAQYRRLYASIHELHDAAYDRFLDASGRVPREPFTVRSISIVLTALADGLLLRALLEEGTDVVTLYEDAVTALLAVVTAGDDGGADLGSVLSSALGGDGTDPG